MSVVPSWCCLAPKSRLTTTTRRSRRRMETLLKRFDHFLPRSCPKTRPLIYTCKCKVVRENTTFAKQPCATSRGLLRQIRDVGILSQNYFAREFTSFSHAKTWSSSQNLSQNYPRSQNWRVGQNHPQFPQSRFRSI